MKQLDSDAVVATGPLVTTSIDIIGFFDLFLAVKFYWN
jgi:cation transporter-like permease